MQTTYPLPTASGGGDPEDPADMPTLAAPVTSRRSLPGRPFQPVAELELHEQLPALARSLPGAARHGCVMVREMPGPNGVADLVVLIGGQPQLDARLQADVPPLLSEIDSAIVGALRVGRAIPKAELAFRIGRAPSAVDRRVGPLCSAGAIALRTHGYVRHPAFDLGGTIHALEAKVRDWNRGIDQTLSYAVWADYSTLVIGALPRDRGPAVARAARLRLGLFSTAWLHRPSDRNHREGLRRWALEHMVAALGGYQPSPSM